MNEMNTVGVQMNHKDDYILIKTNNGDFPALFEILTGDLKGQFFIMKNLSIAPNEAGEQMLSYEYLMVDNEANVASPDEVQKVIVRSCIDNFIDVMSAQIELKHSTLH